MSDHDIKCRCITQDGEMDSAAVGEDHLPHDRTCSTIGHGHCNTLCTRFYHGIGDQVGTTIGDVTAVSGTSGRDEVIYVAVGCVFRDAQLEVSLGSL